MMYVRTFKPAGGHGGGLLKNVFHLAAVATVMAVSFIWLVPGLIEVIYGASIGELLSHHAVPFGVGLAALATVFWLARSGGQVEFGEKNAIDVEAIGLYWHFVDIVWIIIFTAVYLLEYL